MFERPFVVGDYLDFGQGKCKVREVNLRATMVTNDYGADILIPNNTLLSQNLQNWTITDRGRVIEMFVQTVHQTDPFEVIDIIEACMKEQKTVVQGRTEVLFQEISDFGLTFRIKVLIHNIAYENIVKSHLLSLIHTEFVKHGIRYPERKHLTY